ncbi:hypothetical protein CR513_38454, partial [Mucuna pruriens]
MRDDGEKARHSHQEDRVSDVGTHLTLQYETIDHEGKDCQMGNFFTKVLKEANLIVSNQNNLYSFHYNVGWREHPNLSCGGQHTSEAQNIYRPIAMQHQN